MKYIYNILSENQGNLSFIENKIQKTMLVSVKGGFLHFIFRKITLDLIINDNK